MWSLAARVRRWARAIKRDVLALYLAARDPATPWYVRILALAIAAYALSPIDLIPDVIPILGLVDEALLLPLAIMAVVRLIPPDDLARHRAAAETMADRPVSRIAAAVVVAIWLIAAALALWAVWFRR
jgi:uncharacterized membrane protein YkvA (DUF1232 family)